MPASSELLRILTVDKYNHSSKVAVESGCILI